MLQLRVFYLARLQTKQQKSECVTDCMKTNQPSSLSGKGLFFIQPQFYLHLSV